MNNDVAHLCDFGLSNVIAELQGPSFITPTAGGSARWKAPELLEASDNIAPKLAMPCDIYSFASVAFYVSFEPVLSLIIYGLIMFNIYVS